MSNATHTIDIDTHYRLASDNTLILNRTQRSSEPRELFDTFANYWSVGFADLNPGLISLRTRGQLIPLAGPVAILAPPFTILNWVFHQKFSVEWSGLVFQRAYPNHWPRKAILFDLNTASRPQNFSELSSIIDSNPVARPIDKIETENPIALRLKQILDRQFMSEKSLNDFASELGIHHDVMTRYFKGAYGMIPIDYRTQMRLWHSMWSLVFGSPRVTDVAQDVGFRSLKNFYTLFSRYTSLKPSQLRFFSKPRATQTDFLETP